MFVFRSGKTAIFESMLVPEVSIVIGSSYTGTDLILPGKIRESIRDQ
jgi:hypothetical protein